MAALRLMAGHPLKPSTGALSTLLDRVERLYFGMDRAGRLFRYALLAANALIIAFFVTSTFIEPSYFVSTIYVVVAFLVIADFLARLLLSRRLGAFLAQPTSIADIVVVFAILTPFLVPEFAFLRAFQFAALLRSYHVLADLRRTFPWFRQNEDVVKACINLSLFVFIVTGLVYAVEHPTNPEIANYVDALYFTVSTLTTTGFGDIVLKDTVGRALAVAIMLFGVGLFLRLAQAIFRPSRRNFACEKCGHARHEFDAVHCKHCGALLKFPAET
jgi:voltage-gated potassium channel